MMDRCMREMNAREENEGFEFENEKYVRINTWWHDYL